MREIGFAIVGCGMIARFHARALGEIPGVRIAALVSRRVESAERLNSELNLSATCYTELDQALRQPGVDAIIVCTPSGTHLGPALAAADAGKHVVIEKPLEITPERCDRIIAASERRGVNLSVMFPSRFGDANLELRRAVDAGRFGRITLGEATCKWWRSQEYYDRGDWRGTLALDGGGALMNQAIHSVDLLLWLLGDVTHAFGFTGCLAHERIEVEDTAVAGIRFASGALGVIQAATSVHPGYPKSIAIHGNRGSATIEQDEIVRWDFAETAPDDAEIRRRHSGANRVSGGANDPAAISHEGHRRQLADFVDAIREGRRPQVDGREGRKAVAAIAAIYESARTGRAVAVENCR